MISNVGMGRLGWAGLGAVALLVTAVSCANADGLRTRGCAVIRPCASRSLSATTDERNLEQAYERYSDIAAHGGWPQLTFEGELAVGDMGPSVEALRARLRVENLVAKAERPDGAPPSERVFDEDLAASVARAQARYGLVPTGRLDRVTVEALNVPVEDRLAQIATSLDVAKPAPRDAGARRVEVNLADSSVTVVDGAMRSPALPVAGDETIERLSATSSAVTELIFNRPAAAARGVAACGLGRMSFVVVSDRAAGGGRGAPAGSLTVNHRVAGPDCTRLDSAAEMAKRLLVGDSGWSDSSLADALLNDAPIHAPLAAPSPIYVVNRPAFVDERGETNFRGPAGIRPAADFGLARK